MPGVLSIHGAAQPQNNWLDQPDQGAAAQPQILTRNFATGRQQVSETEWPNE